MDGAHLPGWHQVLDHPAYRSYLNDRDLPEPSVEQLREVFPEDGRTFQSGAIDDRPVEASFTSFVTEQALDRLEEYARDYPDTPFYESVHYFGPHNPYYLPEEYFERYDPADVEFAESAVKETFDGKPRVHEIQYDESGLAELDVRDWKRIIAAYRGWVTFIDREIGRLLDRLEELGLADDTVVVFTTDHGGFVTRHKLHDKGPAMYEDIYNVPFITRNLGHEADIEDRFVSLLDLAPTFLDIADVSIPDIYTGRSLLRMDENWRDNCLAEFHGHFFPYEQRMIRRGDYKLVVNEHDVAELYDLSEDPHELQNRITDPRYGDVAHDLYERLVERLRDEGDEFPFEEKTKLTRTENVGLDEFSTRDQ